MRPGVRVSAGAVNDLFDIVHGARGGDGNTLVELRHGGMRITSRPSSSLPRPFGISKLNISAGTVTVRRGIVKHGQTTIIIDSADVAIAGGTKAAPTYAYAAYDVNARSGAIQTATVATMPDSTGGASPVVAIPLFSAYLVRDVIVIAEILWEGIYPLDGVYA
jgi:hypothetical protein